MPFHLLFLQQVKQRPKTHLLLQADTETLLSHSMTSKKNKNKIKSINQSINQITEWEGTRQMRGCLFEAGTCLREHVYLRWTLE